MVDAGSHLARAREYFDGSCWQQACAEILAKLGASSRTAAATYAVQHGIA